MCVCVLPALAPLTDKMEQSAKHFFDSPGSHDDARQKKNPKNPKKNEDDLPTNSVVCFCAVVFLHILGSQDFLVPLGSLTSGR